MSEPNTDTDGDEVNPHRLIFGREIDEDDGVSHFARGDHNLGDPITPEDADILMQSGYLLPDMRQNDGPPANALCVRAGSVQRLVASHEDMDNVSIRLIGYVVPDHRPDSRITLNGMVATPVEDDGVIPDHVKHEFELLGDRQIALDDETETQTGSLFAPADELTTDDTLCRVWWD
jgi:hypothetical protein